MNPAAEISTEGFARVVAELAQISGKTFEEVLLHQTAAVLNACIRYTPKAKRGIIVKRASKRNNYVEFASGHIVALWKKAGNAEMFLDISTWNGKGKLPRGINGKTWHQMSGAGRGGGKRWSNERWARWIAYEQAARRAQVDPKKAAQAAGLTAASWLQCAKDLGIEVNAPGSVRNARPGNDQTYKNGTARKILDVAACYIEISNNNPILIKKLGGWGILQAALRSREKAFQIDLAKGTFNDMKRRAQRYPGIFVHE